MKTIVLFALVCVAFAQVHGSELDDAIKKAIEKLDSISNNTQRSVESAKRHSQDIRGVIAMRSEYYLNKTKDVHVQATNSIKEVAKELIAKAKGGKNPEETIKCITKEEQSTISTISTLTTTVEADVKQARNDKVVKVDEKGKEAKKIEDELPGRYKQGVADLKKCKDVSAVHQTLVKLEGEYSQVMLDCEELIEKILSALSDFDMAVSSATKKYQHTIEKVKTQGVNKMRECMPKLA